MFTYSNMVRLQIGLFADDALRSIYLAKLRIDGTDADVSTKAAVESLIGKSVSVAKAFRSLEIVLKDGRAQVNPEIIKALADDGLSTLQMLHRLLGRCVYRGGLYWFHVMDETLTPYDIVSEYEGDAGHHPLDISPTFKQWVADNLEESGGRSWATRSWVPCEGESQFSIKVVKHNGVIHAEVMKQDNLGNVGFGSKAFNDMEAFDRAFMSAWERADCDFIAHRMFIEWRVAEEESGNSQTYLRRVVADAMLPEGYTSDGWQPSETPLTGEQRDKAETLILSGRKGRGFKFTNLSP